MKSLDPAIIDMILGRPDAELMKEDMATALDSTRDESERINALDHLEMLIEQIDNANNLGKLKMWGPLHSLLTSDASTPSIKMYALWVIGTALQNNPEAQDAYLSCKPLPTLLSFLSPSPSSTIQTRSKALYAISGLLKHNQPSVKALGDAEVDGWPKLRDSLMDPEISVRRKTLFLLNTLLTPTSPPSASSSTNLHSPTSAPDPQIHANSHSVHLSDPSRASTSHLTLQALQTHNILSTVVDGLINILPYGEDGDIDVPDVDFEEKGVRFLHTYAVGCGGHFPDPIKAALKTWFEKTTRTLDQSQQSERWGLTTLEIQALVKRLSDELIAIFTHLMYHR
ncbi:armadillo-type protein [Infundibulicybe gibba]|nr:armadillo-type protein [Infundibulicybe gibba]